MIEISTSFSYGRKISDINDAPISDMVVTP
jgi:hypothetical protein